MVCDVLHCVNHGRDVSGEGGAIPARGNGHMDKGASRSGEKGDSGEVARSERQGECCITHHVPLLLSFYSLRLVSF